MRTVRLCGNTVQNVALDFFGGTLVDVKIRGRAVI